ncbi:MULTISPECIES: succinylglutamate desuccinylase/aspartoacylase family protein [unclassified Rhizobium]|uniref:succinylglutamate desuccinylase/aspartoacylase domain-containing protein n=1 Tax=unclassified Rhizobium TaxID=2613769 RepID=UPI0037F8B638
MSVENLVLPSGDIIVAHRFGNPGIRPFVYLQGGLHADEVSSTVALEQLVRLLGELVGGSCIRGEIVVLPHCNPIGLKQFLLGRHQGRFSLSDGSNFNRGFPDMAAMLRPVLDAPSADFGRDRVAELGRHILTRQGTTGPTRALQAELMRLSWGADYVIDVHADMEASVHIYSSAVSWAKLRTVAGRLSARVVILAEESADRPFDEAHSRAWQDLGLPSSTASCTLELRGLSDVSAETASNDALGLLHFLGDIGAVEVAAPSPPDPDTKTISLEDLEFVESPQSGIVMHLVDVGAPVTKGDIVARIFDPTNPSLDSAWTDVATQRDGCVFARWHQRVIQAGMPICKIAGSGLGGKRETRLSD